LFNSNKQKTKYPLRRIEAIRAENNEPITFVTNIPDLDAAEITEIYKKRWDIEVFFKFIKQLLNFKHLINRSENGIKVVLYVTMIAAILLIAYKKENHLTGFKIVKQKLEQELETAILKDIITMCGGNPQLLTYLLYSKDP
jgi:IS4 transposase